MLYSTPHHLKVMTPPNMLLNKPLPHRLLPPHHIIPSLHNHIIKIRPLPQPTLPTGQLLAPVRKVTLDILALPLKLRLGDVLLRRDILGAFDPLQRKTAIDVPHDVAMHEPRARVVGLETNNGVPGGSGGATGALQHDGVATDGVDEVECAGHAGVPDGVTLAQDGHVVAVHVHGVGGEELVLDHKVVPLVGLVEDDGVRDGVVGSAGGVGEGL